MDIITKVAATWNGDITHPHHHEPQLVGESVNNTVMLAGFAFEAYADPKVTWATVAEKDCWENACETQYLTSNFLKELYTGWLTVHLEQPHLEMNKDNRLNSAFAVVKVGQTDPGSQVVKRWGVAKTGKIRSARGQIWEDEVQLPVRVPAEDGRTVVAKVEIYIDPPFLPPVLVLSVQIPLEGIRPGISLAPVELSPLVGPKLIATVLFHPFQLNEPATSLSESLSAFKLFEGMTCVAESIDGDPSAFSPNGSPLLTSTIQPETQQQSNELISWAKVPMTVPEWRALRLLFNNRNLIPPWGCPMSFADYKASQLLFNHRNILAPWAMLLAALEKKPGMADSSMAKYEKIAYFHGLETDTDVALWRNTEDRVVVLAFRGTSVVNDAITDGQGRPTLWTNIDLPKRLWEWPFIQWVDFIFVLIASLLRKLTLRNLDVMVHFGFFRSYASVRDSIVNTLKYVTRDGNWRVFVTGHSLGGALASVAAYDLARTDVLGSKPKIHLACYTYGSPRVGNSAFADDFDSTVSESFRIVDRDDCVPTVPRLQGFLCHVKGGVALNPKRYPASKEPAEIEMPIDARRSAVTFDFGFVSLIRFFIQIWEGQDSVGIVSHLFPHYFLAILHKVEDVLGKSPILA